MYSLIIRCVFVVDQILSCCLEIIKHILFISQHATFMPGFTILPIKRTEIMHSINHYLQKQHMFLNGLYGIRSLPRNNNNDVVNIHVRLLGWHKLYWPSTSDIGHSKHTSQVLHEDQSGHGEMWRDGDVEASVSIQQTGVAPIQGKILNHTNIMWLRHFDYS